MADRVAIPVTLKWSKQSFQGLQIVPGSSTSTFQLGVQSLTGVPVERQKLLCKQGWKGTLRSDSTFDDNLSLPRNQSALSVTLIGSADTLTWPVKQSTRFLEDITDEEAAAAEAARDAAAMDEAEGMIVALQYPPGEYRNDGKMFGQMYQYNHRVTGLPQLQIESLLSSRSKNAMLGKVVMTLGLELRRAYVNALAVLSTGTLVSAHDDGHMQLWEHGEMVRDVVHEGVQEGGVDCLVTLTAAGSPNSSAFASGGKGCVRLWTDEAECLGVLRTPPGSSPSSIRSIPMPNGILCLAACLKITRQSNPNQFRLPPQDEEGRRRRAEAQAREQAINESLARVSQSVWVWSGPQMQSVALESHDDAAAASTALAVLSGDNQDDAVLICGDTMGGLRFWRGHHNLSSSQVQWEQWKLLQLRSADAVVSVVCMESLMDRRLAVSTERSSSAGAFSLAGSVGLDAPFFNAIYILNTNSNSVQQTLTGHQDAVICMCSLPHGGLATGGGKMDATVRVWDSSQLSGNEEPVLNESAATLNEVGYVFSLAVLPDSKPGSQHYALAAARYNVVKICL